MGRGMSRRESQEILNQLAGMAEVGKRCSSMDGTPVQHSPTDCAASTPTASPAATWVRMNLSCSREGGQGRRRRRESSTCSILGCIDRGEAGVGEKIELQWARKRCHKKFSTGDSCHRTIIGQALPHQPPPA